jgi:nitroreductase
MMTTIDPLRASRRRGDVAANFVIRAAVAAPSVQNSQPWHFSSRPGAIRLHADPRRGLPQADPAGREMVISCGAALFNIRLAMRHLGFAAGVTLLPDPSCPDLLAEVRWGSFTPPAPGEEALYRSIPLRHTHRGPFTAGPSPLRRRPRSSVT